MVIQKKWAALFCAMLALALFATACSQDISGTGSQASNLTPLQVLQKSGDAMKQLKSSHVDLQSTSSAQTSGPTSGTPTVASTPVNGNVTIKGSGVQALPDQQQMDFTINDTKIAEIVQGEKVYVQNAQGKWYVMDKSTLASYIGNPFSSVNVDQGALIALVQHTKITDKGTESLNGQNLRHISAELDKVAIKQLFADNPQLKSQLGNQDVDTVLDHTKSFLSTVDVWIDETNFYLHRTQLKLNLDADTSTVGNGAPSAVKATLDTIVDLSKFNDPVTITPPTNATPTTDPTSVFSV